MTGLVKLFYWALANKAELLADVVGIIGSARVLLAALAKLIDLFVTVFPALKPADGKLHWAIGWIDGIAQNSWLNAVALTPKPKVAHAVDPAVTCSPPSAPKFIPPAMVGLLLLSLLLPAPARAQALFSSGPTLPLMEIRPGNPHPVSLAAGAGYQLNLTWAGVQKAIGGKSWDLLAFNGMVFGSAVSGSSGSTFGALSAALGVCTLSSLLCVGGGHDIVTSNGNAGGWFGLFAFSINFGTAPSAPPAGVEHGPLGLPRGNTLFWGSP